MLLGLVKLVSNTLLRFLIPFVAEGHPLLFRFQKSSWRTCSHILDWIRDTVQWRAFVLAAKRTTPIGWTQLLCPCSESPKIWFWVSEQNSSSSLERTTSKRPKTESWAIFHRPPRMILPNAAGSPTPAARLDFSRRAQWCFRTRSALPNASTWPGISSYRGNRSYWICIYSAAGDARCESFETIQTRNRLWPLLPLLRLPRCHEQDPFLSPRLP